MAAHYRPPKQASDSFVDACETVFLKRTECFFFFFEKKSLKFERFCLSADSPKQLNQVRHGVSFSPRSVRHAVGGGDNELSHV